LKGGDNTMKYVYVVDCDHHVPSVFEDEDEAHNHVDVLRKDRDSGRIWLLRNQVMTNPKTGKLSWIWDGTDALFWK